MSPKLGLTAPRPGGAAACSTTSTGIGVIVATRSTGSAASCAAVPTDSPSGPGVGCEPDWSPATPRGGGQPPPGTIAQDLMRCYQLRDASGRGSSPSPPPATCPVPENRPPGKNIAHMAGGVPRALRPHRRLQWADRILEPEDQEHQAHRARIPQLSATTGSASFSTTAESRTIIRHHGSETRRPSLVA